MNNSSNLTLNKNDKKIIYVLILARIIQGIRMGLLLLVMQTIIVLAVGREKTSLALSSISIPSVLAPILGAFIAAILLQFFDWIGKYTVF